MEIAKTDPIHTRDEIYGQPQLWEQTIHMLTGTPAIRSFLKPLLERDELNIVLTGAGSSAYIGEAVEPVLHQGRRVRARAVSTTTLVTHTPSYIDPETPLLLISFARSGNSPESIAAIDQLNRHCSRIWHIALTCNRDGELARLVGGMENGLAVILPVASDDKGLAMTGSFTSMMLSAIYMGEILRVPDQEQTEIIRNISAAAGEALQETPGKIREMVSLPFDRIVFLGSGPLQAVARESHLKVQELTDGLVVGKFDSFLGFRHGPKAVVNEKTLVAFLFSGDPKVFRYEKDLVEEILNDGMAMGCIGIFTDRDQSGQLDLDLKILFDLDEKARRSPLHRIPLAIPSQLIGLYKSLELGLNPDSPSRKNTISRVVQGVKIYR